MVTSSVSHYRQKATGVALASSSTIVPTTSSNAADGTPTGGLHRPAAIDDGGGVRTATSASWTSPMTAAYATNRNKWRNGRSQSHLTVNEEEMKGFRRHIDLCVALVDYKTKLQREIRGLCSEYVRMLQVSVDRYHRSELTAS